MLFSFTAVRQSLWSIGCLSVDVFFGGQRNGLQRSLILLFTCTFSSLLISSAFLLYLHFVLRYNLAVAGGISAGIGTLMTTAFYLSKRMRCLGTLFLISVFMKKSRTLLLTAGTSLVALRNIQNTLENLKGLLESMICNVRAKKEALIDPFKKYVEILKWISDALKGFTQLTDIKVWKMDTQLTVTPRLESGPLEEVLTEAKQTLNGTVKYALTIVSTISSVTEKLFPAISLVVLAALIMLHIKRFHKDLKYRNRFISRKFVEFDEKQKAEGKPHVLPLTPKEAEAYTVLPSVRPTSQEGRAMLKFGIPVATHFVAWSIIITVDALLYCFVAVVTTKFSELEPLHVPLLMNMKVSLLYPFVAAGTAFFFFVKSWIASRPSCQTPVESIFGFSSTLDASSFPSLKTAK